MIGNDTMVGNYLFDAWFWGFAEGSFGIKVVPVIGLYDALPTTTPAPTTLSPMVRLSWFCARPCVSDPVF